MNHHTWNFLRDFWELNSGTHVSIIIAFTTEPALQPLCQPQTAGTRLGHVGVSEWIKEWNATLTFYGGGEVCSEKRVQRWVIILCKPGRMPSQTPAAVSQEDDLRRPLSYRLLFTVMTLYGTYLKLYLEPWARQVWEPYQNFVLDLMNALETSPLLHCTIVQTKWSISRWCWSFENLWHQSCPTPL